MRWALAFVLAVVPVAAGASHGQANPNFLEREIAGAHVGLTLSHLQTVLEDEGFTFLRIQNVDKGLAAKGFDRPPYKLIFFGNRRQFERARRIDPRVTPYLPLKVTVYQGPDGDTHLSVVDPAVVGRMFNPGLQNLFRKWSEAMTRILDRTVKRVEASTFSP